VGSILQIEPDYLLIGILLPEPKYFGDFGGQFITEANKWFNQND
jgi:hypothetical protein